MGLAQEPRAGRGQERLRAGLLRPAHRSRNRPEGRTRPASLPSQTKMPGSTSRRLVPCVAIARKRLKPLTYRQSTTLGGHPGARRSLRSQVVPAPRGAHQNSKDESSRRGSAPAIPHRQRPRAVSPAREAAPRLPAESSSKAPFRSGKG